MPAVRGADTIRIDGLDEFRRELRALGGDLPRALGQAHKRIGQFVAEKATATASGLGPMQGKAARLGLKPRAAQADARITLDAGAAPWILGAEFGASRWRQFRPWRGNGEDAGYFLWPTIRSETDRIVDLMADELMTISARAFPS